MPDRSPATGRRMLVLDVVRGIAICGILFTNISALLNASVPTTDALHPPVTSTVEHLLFKERFFPVFSFLFGISFGIIWGSATRRAAHPRVILLRRLLGLALFAAVHVLLHPGEALSVYAIVGLVVLLPATFIPERYRTRVCAILGVILLVPGLYLGAQMEVPGLFLTGFAVARSGLVRRFEDSPRPGLMLAVPAAIVAAIFIPMQLAHPETAGFGPVSAIAGVATAAALIGLVAMALHTPLREALGWFFAPLGKMALTNYIGATLVATVARLILFPQLGGAIFITLLSYKGVPDIPLTEGQYLTIWAGCAALLVIQSLVSRAWLARFRQGPLEKLWHTLTWAGAKPRETPVDGHGADVGREPAKMPL